MKLSVYILVFIACITPVCADMFVSVNSSSLPYASYHMLNVTLTENSTVFLNRIDSESRLQMFFPASVIINETNRTSINLSYNVPPFVANESVNLTALFNVSNSDNDQTGIFNLTVQVNFTGSANVVEIRVLSDSQIVNVTSNLLPLEGYLLYNVSGLPQSTVNISCDGTILRCPSSLIVDSNGISIAQIRYRVEFTQSAGTFSYNITFNYANYSRTTNATFVIIEPSVEQLRFVYTPDCFEYKVQGDNTSIALITRECAQRLDDFNARQISWMLERLDALRNASNFCPVTIETQYVMTGQINKTIAEEYSQCKQDRNDFSQRLSECSVSLTQTQTSFGACTSQLLDNESKAINDAHAYMTKADNKIDYAKAELSSRIKTIIITVIIVLVIIFFAYLIIKGREEESFTDGG